MTELNATKLSNEEVNTMNEDREMLTVMDVEDTIRAAYEEMLKKLNTTYVPLAVQEILVKAFMDIK